MTNGQFNYSYKQHLNTSFIYYDSKKTSQRQHSIYLQILHKTILKFIWLF